VPGSCCGPDRLATPIGGEGQPTGEDCENNIPCIYDSIIRGSICIQSGQGYCCCAECSDFFNTGCNAGEMCCFGTCVQFNPMGC
jgi:hypothetical protein